MIRSFIFNVLFFAWIALTVFCGLFLFFFPEKYLFAWIRTWARGSLALCRYVVGITYEIRGQEHLQEGAIIACRHESFWETIVFHAFIYKPRYVLKKQLMDIPCYGQVLKKLGSIAVDRDKGARSVAALMRQTERAVKKGGMFVIFPEGTRMPPKTMGQVKPGVYVMYRAAQKPVIPAMVNTGRFWARRQFLKYPGHIVLSFLPPIPVGLNKDAFMERLQHDFEEAHRDYIQKGWTV